VTLAVTVSPDKRAFHGTNSNATSLRPAAT
jgi:hypothetical protein